MFLSRVILISNPQNAEDVKIGPIPLPLFIVVCMFAPFVIAGIVFVVHRLWMKWSRNRKAAGEQDEV
ncbi:uncharacterized protein K460DRAFT_272221 [Cucurbitaria berberidis CBS 394.84]|uniref:Uncharacterized protein n=1 Tax=Cucurbitaria berberidis CBS 394.84 TaxID=1168544 RepID=A0A9P4LD14_9PLEO|nr:uncharacterized protein K460DRAFT_272221 [Cucurbitaria berberidis CBS 394.84]KAF1850580.1 hypothetical protein K460DRAFT_272221 [Cucurbitaria berberidis CBS 394.84]